MAKQDGQEKNQRGRIQTLWSNQWQGNIKGGIAMFEKYSTPSYPEDEATKQPFGHRVHRNLRTTCFSDTHTLNTSRRIML
jgi:hypothetical protein